MNTPADQEQPAYLVYLQPAADLTPSRPGLTRGGEAANANSVERLPPPALAMSGSAHPNPTSHALVHAVLCIPLAPAELPLPGIALEWQALEPALRRAGASGRPLQLLLCATSPIPPDEPAAEPPHGTDGFTLPSAPHTPLSIREIEVLERIAMGKSNKVIARDLGLSPHTVKRHVARILNKTRQASRGQAANWYWHNGRRKEPQQHACGISPLP
jgi:DNA-binding CsgD family transcriptional regulator